MYSLRPCSPSPTTAAVVVTLTRGHMQQAHLPPSPLRVRRVRASRSFYREISSSAFSSLLDPGVPEYNYIFLFSIKVPNTIIFRDKVVRITCMVNLLERLVRVDNRSTFYQQPNNRLRRRRQALGCCWSRVRYLQITSTYRQGPIEADRKSQSKNYQVINHFLCCRPADNLSVDGPRVLLGGRPGERHLLGRDLHVHGWHHQGEYVHGVTRGCA